MMKDKVFVIDSNATRIVVQCGRTGETRSVRLPITLKGSRVRTTEMKNNKSSTVRSPEATQSKKRRSILEWYFVLRTHYQWSIFQAIRYALWLAR